MPYQCIIKYKTKTYTSEQGKTNEQKRVEEDTQNTYRFRKPLIHKLKKALKIPNWKP